MFASSFLTMKVSLMIIATCAILGMNNMARARNVNQQRIFHWLYQGQMTSGAGNYKFNGVLADIKSALESLAGQGEEVKITKAILKILIWHGGASTTPSMTQISAAVGDAVISATNPGENSQQGYLDDDIDVCASGDYEMKHLGDLVEKPLELSTLEWSGQTTIDITNVVSKASSMLSRSAILSTNPYAVIIANGINGQANPTINFQSQMIWYCGIRQKPLRMLA